MKSSRSNSRDGFGSTNTQQKRKNGSRGSNEKWSNSRKLDRKSSRGMIYENEELRLRTININAEVERGQNDIRKLRRENEQLKREIWNLRDEYDKLHQFLNTNHNSCENLGDRTLNSGSQSEDSCDACKENDSANEKSKDNYYNITTTIPTNVILNENHNNIKINNDSPLPNRKKSLKTSLESIQLQNEHHEIFQQQQIQQSQIKKLSIKDEKMQIETENNGIHYLNFDHLSIVSEENLTNSDGSNISIHNQSNDINYDDLMKPQLQQNYQNLFHDNLNNLTINQLQQNSLIRGTTLPQLTFPTQTTPPPQLRNLTLNLNQNLPYVNVETPAINTGITVIPPLSHFENICDEKFGLTVDTNCVRDPCDENIIKSKQNISNIKNENDTLSSIIEMKSPKHFFSPIKPNSEIVAIKTLPPHKPNLVLSKTSLQQLSSSPPSLPPSPLSMQFLKFNTGPPDICVANVLGTNNNETIRNTNTSSSKFHPDDQLFQNGGNLEELLLDIQNLSNNSQININNGTIINKQEQQQPLKTFTANRNNNQISNSHSNTNINIENTINKISENSIKNQNNNILPLHRSEINLILNYNNNSEEIQSNNGINNIDIDNLQQQTDGIHSTTITTATTITTTANTTTTVSTITNLQNNHELSSGTESLPRPMALFPSQLSYIGFENMMLPTISDQQIINYTQRNSNMDGPINTNKMIGISDILTKTTDTTSSNTSIFKSNNTTDSEESVLKTPKSISSNCNDQKQALMYNSKTKLLRKDELEFSQSVDNLIAMNRKLGVNIENLSSSVNDLLKPLNCDEFNLVNQQPDQQLNETNNPIISNVCQSQIHSTPNSPHSVGKRFNGNINKNRHIHNQYQNNRKLSHESSRSTSGISLTATGGKNLGNNNVNGVKTSASSLEDGTTLTTIQSSTSRGGGSGGGSGSGGSGATIKSNSRRHSEGTVILQHLNRHHHHHNHHSHQHNDNESFLGNLNMPNKNRNYKNSAISIIHHGDSNHDLITGVGNRILMQSTSERNSNNSLVSSRESSTSLNISTSRRKMSNVSHNGGGKIPWCGCWGNGCL